MSDTIYIPPSARPLFPTATALLDGIGTLLNEHARRDSDAQAYARLVRDLLAILGAPTITAYPDRYGSTSHKIEHPDSRVQRALDRLCYYKSQLMEIGLLSADAPATGGAA